MQPPWTRDGAASSRAQRLGGIGEANGTPRAVWAGVFLLLAYLGLAAASRSSAHFLCDVSSSPVLVLSVRSGTLYGVLVTMTSKCLTVLYSQGLSGNI